MYPIIVPSIGFDDRLAAHIAVSLTGMSVDMGNYLDMSKGTCSFFDDRRVNELSRDYLGHRITWDRYVEQMIEYFTARSEPWGFKFTTGIEMLPLFRHFLPEMSVIIPVPDEDHVELEMHEAALVAGDSPTMPTIAEHLQRYRAWKKSAERLTNIVPCLLIPHNFFYEFREKALVKIAEMLCNNNRDYRRIGRLVRSAERKMQYVYTGAEVNGTD